MTTARTLVLSLGNPAPYRDTLHSAGHIALEALRRELGLPAFAKAAGRPSAPTTAGTDADGRPIALLQSPTLMNVSGPWVARVWRAAVADDSAAGAGTAPRLVLVHDDLEEPLGAVRARPWTRSARGHNGVKSVQASLPRPSPADAVWVRLTVGIGRPAARDAATVADYVLRPMDAAQRAALEQGLGGRMVAALRGVGDGQATGRS